MPTKEFNELPLPEKTRLVFSQGKLINIYQDHTMQKGFFYKLDKLKVDVIYDTIHNRLLDIIAWENSDERVVFLKMLA